MNTHYQSLDMKWCFSHHWLIVVAFISLFSTLGCGLARVMAKPEGLAARTHPVAKVRQEATPTRTSLPTLTPTPFPSPTPGPTATPVSLALSANTPLPTATATATRPSFPTATPWPTQTFTPAPPTLTPTATFTLAPTYPYVVAEIYKDFTSNHFLTGYIAIVNNQEIPIGGMKAVGVFEPGGYRYETPLSKWFFEGYSVPGEVIKTGSVKFEPSGGIQKGTWFIHLENEGGQRFSEDVPIATDPVNREWFFIKFKDITSSPVPTATPLLVLIPSQDAILTNRPSPVTATPLPTSPLITPVSPTGGWSFANLRTEADSNLVSVTIYGEVVNNTGIAQEILNMTGHFYDDQGRMIAGEDETGGFWPVDIIPAGGRVPFELIVFGVDWIANFDLRVLSQPPD
jgi:hypothetical protein